MNPEHSFPPISPEDRDPRQHIRSADVETEEGQEERSRLSEEIRRWWRGDGHAHSAESTRKGFENAEGVYDLDEIAAYYEQLGLEFTAITEHASNPGQPEVLTPESEISQSLLAEAQRITDRNRESSGDFALFSGVEANVLFDANGEPTIDVPPEVLAKLDLVVASRHTIAREKDLPSIESSLLYAAGHPQVDAIGHPDRYLMASNDWGFLALNNPEAAALEGDMQRMRKEQKALPEQSTERQALTKALEQTYTTIRKVVGKKSLEEQDATDETVQRLHAAYQELEKQYLSMWERVLTVMAHEGKAFEINFHAQPSEKVVRMAAAAGVPFLLNYDAHDFDAYKWQHTDEQRAAYAAKKRWAKEEMNEEDQEVLRDYKLDRLAHGPGVIPLLRLVRWIRRLEAMGVTPDRVVNSSRDRMVRFLTEERGKTTPNLNVIQEKAEQTMTSGQ
ncbi:MAG: hypothetical protein V1778_02885 [bacterium]